MSSLIVQQSQTGKVWLSHDDCERTVLFLCQQYRVSDFCARLAARRMKSAAESEEIFAPYLKNHLLDPSFLPDIDVACQHILLCLQQGEPIAVWGDYDVDGACATALFIKCFKILKHPATVYIPDRFLEGYGPNITGLKTLWDKGIHTIVIVDCGTTSVDVLSQAHQWGMNIIIIDHHTVGPVHPPCLALINPKRLDVSCPSDLTQLCAGALVFLFLVGFNRHLRQAHYFEIHECAELDLYRMLDLVAFSTVCDMMPLRHINRAFVKQGLKIMQQRQNIGIASLMDATKVRGPVNVSHLGYVLGPRINAGGRIGDASLGARLLSCDTLSEAMEFSQELQLLNQERQVIQRHTLEQVYHQASTMNHRPYIFVHDDQWHEGILGILASHLKENFAKPSFALTMKGSLMKGSVRSVPGVDISSLILQAISQGLLHSGGGHPMAGGLTINPLRIPDFLSFLDQYFNAHPLPVETPSIVVDGAITFEQIRDPSFFQDLDTVGPFGVDYPVPRFVLSNIALENIKLFGANHLRMMGVQMNGQSHPMVFFRHGDKPIGKWLLEHRLQRVHCVVTVQADEYAGRQRALVMIEDIAT